MTIRRRILMGASAALAAATIAATPLTASAKTTLRITLQLPLKSHLGQNVLRFKQNVEKASNGEVSVQIFDSAQLYKDSEVPKAVGSGSIEAGVASLTRYVGDIPAVDVFYMPFLFPGEAAVRKAVAPGSPVRAPLDAAIMKTGSRVLWWQAYGGSILLSKGGPIKSPADMKGKKVRVFSKTLGDWVTAVGGAPTLVSGSEQYLAYQRGTVDIGTTGVSGVKSRKLWEVMDTITLTNNADIEFLVVVNEKFWQGLPAQHRDWIMAAARDAETHVRDAMSKIEADAIAAAKKNRMTVYTPNDAEMAAWKASGKSVVEKWLKRSGETGRQVYEAALKL